MKRSLGLFVVFCFLSGEVATLRAAIVHWDVASGGNGNFYEAVLDEALWADAKILAEQRTLGGVSGHLATITSAAEQAFLQSAGLPATSYQIGGFQDTSAPDYSEPNGGWRWVTGEPFSYTNWRGGEPNNTDQEDIIGIESHSGYLWNDGKAYRAGPYLVEYGAAAIAGLTAEDILGGAVKWVFGDTVHAVFTPQLGLSLSQAANMLGFDHFNFLQIVEELGVLDRVNPGFFDRFLLPHPTPFPDPLPGGYKYQNAFPFSPTRDFLPFYLDESFLTHTAVRSDGLTATHDLEFFTNSTPSPVTITSASGRSVSLPANSLFMFDDPHVSFARFKTQLVGVRSDGSFEVFDSTLGTSREWTAMGSQSVALENIFPEVEPDNTITDLGEAQLNSADIALIESLGGNLQSGATVVPEPSSLVIHMVLLGFVTLGCLMLKKSRVRRRKTASNPVDF